MLTYIIYIYTTCVNKTIYTRLIIEREAPNGMVKPLIMSGALKLLDAEQKCNFGTKNCREFSEDAGALARLALSKYRELKVDEGARERCFRKAFCQFLTISKSCCYVILIVTSLFYHVHHRVTIIVSHNYFFSSLLFVTSGYAGPDRCDRNRPFEAHDRWARWIANTIAVAVAIASSWRVYGFDELPPHPRGDCPSRE